MPSSHFRNSFQAQWFQAVDGAKPSPFRNSLQAQWYQALDGVKRQEEVKVAEVKISEAVEEANEKLKGAQLSFDQVFKARHHEQTGSTLDKKTLDNDVRRVRSRDRRANFLLLHPLGPFMQMWDIVTLIAIVFTVVVTPCMRARSADGCTLRTRDWITCCISSHLDYIFERHN